MTLNCTNDKTLRHKTETTKKGASLKKRSLENSLLHCICQFTVGMLKISRVSSILNKTGKSQQNEQQLLRVCYFTLLQVSRIRVFR